MALGGRLALVTGGSSGIGEAVCRALATEGATVIVAARRLKIALEVAQSLPGDQKHCAMHVDVGEPSSVDTLFRNIRTTFQQPLSIVVNCAGTCTFSPIPDCNDDIFDEVIRINLKGTFLVTRAASQEMLRWKEKLPEGGGAIVNVSSTLANVCTARFSAYAASKAGIEALTKVTARELAAHDIRCNTVIPSWTDTPLTAALGEDMRSTAISRTPLKRTAKPQEIAEAIVFLCSPKSSSYITGSSMVVSGGLWM